MTSASSSHRKDDKTSTINNSSTAGNLTNLNDVQEILSLFPTGITHAIGYGSGVFAQTLPSTSNDISKNRPDETIKSGNDDLPMIDLILAVDDPLAFHTQNLSLHSHHYATLARSLGPNFISWAQCCSLGAKLYFNPLVSVNLQSGTAHERTRMIKYGIVTTDDLLQDLEQWEFLYVAGRMQKPTLLIEGNDQIIEAQHFHNLKYALSASLLLLSHEVQNNKNNENTVSLPINTVFEQIARLSYSGDPRMAVGGEDPRKVEKLVHSPGQANRFFDLYKDQLVDLEHMGVISISTGKGKLESTRHVEWNQNDPSAHKLLWERMPQRLRGGREIALLGSAIASIVAPAARGQSIKGVLTAGIGRSLRYAGAKFAKGWNLNG